MSDIHIQISYEGDGLPSASDLAQRHAVEDAIEDADIGEVVDAGGGMGVMDIYVAVDHVATALAKTKEIVKRLDLHDRTTVESVSDPDV